jgi:hypothetical protein
VGRSLPVRISDFFSWKENTNRILGFCDKHALILYVYLKTGDDNATDGSCLTVSLYHEASGTELTIAIVLH